MAIGWGFHPLLEDKNRMFSIPTGSIIGEIHPPSGEVE
jgi:hypothetical protein